MYCLASTCLCVCAFLQLTSSLILSNKYCYSSFLMNSVCVEYLLLAPYFQSVSILRSEVDLLQTSSLVFVSIQPVYVFWLVHLICLHLKVIIDMDDAIAIFLIALALLFVGLFHLLCFLFRKVPLAFVVKLVWWC